METVQRFCGRLYGVLRFKAILYNDVLSIGCRYDVWTFNMLIHGLCKKGFLDQLANWSIRKPNVITYTILIDRFCKEGELERAGNVLKEMYSKGLNLEIVGYNILINICTIQGWKGP
ncbi:hypothetical protein FNV43_RR21678 [Rhamnella rubrinervis]|uniref:Pentatricopeptide repeat-containing protein n=1 Tax=Rhamnella rubrinervis TaxID=2594499 RepID=A0A8K0GRU7_9ROSA|nr:hypothetical protein FNV43_RR21678 [Rhamnella rubrinervis]